MGGVGILMYALGLDDKNLNANHSTLDCKFQLAEVAVPRELFRTILSLIDDLRPRPAPA